MEKSSTNKAILIFALIVLFLSINTILDSKVFAGDTEESVKTIGGRVIELGSGSFVTSGTIKLYKVQGSSNILIKEGEVRVNGTYIFKDLNLMNNDYIRIMAYPNDVIENDHSLETTPTIRLAPELIVNNTFTHDVYVDWQILATLPRVKLFQNYPNPFNPITVIEYEIPFFAFVNLSVYDASGKNVSTLVNNHESPGVKQVSFNGHSLPSGVYYCKLSVGGYNDYKLMTLLK